MIIDSITRKRAVELSGCNLPYRMRWYNVGGLQFYPRFGDYKFLTAGDDGLQGVIGKRKRVTGAAEIALTVDVAAGERRAA